MRRENKTSSSQRVGNWNSYAWENRQCKTEGWKIPRYSITPTHLQLKNSMKVRDAILARGGVAHSWAWQSRRGAFPPKLFSRAFSRSRMSLPSHCWRSCLRKRGRREGKEEVKKHLYLRFTKHLSAESPILTNVASSRNYLCFFEPFECCGFDFSPLLERTKSSVKPIFYFSTFYAQLSSLLRIIAYFTKCDRVRAHQENGIALFYNLTESDGKRDRLKRCNISGFLIGTA